MGKRDIIRNLGSNWFALGINVLVCIFLSPYTLHRLGDEAFGLWILIFCLTGYHGFFDLGIRSSIVRYIAKYSTTDEREDLYRLVNTAMFGYTPIAVVTITATLIMTYYVYYISLRIPAGFVPTARWLLLMVGTSISPGFPMGVLSGILEGLQRFYLLNLTNTCSTLLRALLSVVALQHGRGLLTVALIATSLPQLGQLINAIAVFRRLPLRFGPNCVSRSSKRRIASYRGPGF